MKPRLHQERVPGRGIFCESRTLGRAVVVDMSRAEDVLL